MRRLPVIMLAWSVATCFAWLPTLSCAQEAQDSPNEVQDAPADQAATLQPQARTAEDLFTLPDSAKFGLRAPVASLRERIQMPYGLNYYRDSKTLLMQLDRKDEWGVGLNLNLGNSPNTESSSSGLLLPPRRTPGLMFQKKF